MSETKQPVWKLLVNLGDVGYLDYGGYFIYTDETGVYPPEAEILELDNETDENSTYTISRFVLDPCTLVNGILSDNKFHPEHPAWFADRIDSIASCMGMTPDELRQELCSPDPQERAQGYRCLTDYFGACEFDHYPLTDLSRAEVEERYKKK